MASSRLRNYLLEAYIHIERLKEVLNALKDLYPLDVKKYNNLDVSEKNILDSLAFRFAKLQDLIGAKIFREYLKESGFIIEEKSFWEILKEIEKEGIIDIDTWSELRRVRNTIAHDYPEGLEEKIEAINYLIEHSPILIEVVKKIERKIETKIK